MNKPVFTICFLTSKSMTATDEERLPYITKKGKRTENENKKVKKKSREKLEAFAKEHGLRLKENEHKLISPGDCYIIECEEE